MSSTTSVESEKKHPIVHEGAVTSDEKHPMDYEGQFNEEELSIIDDHIDDKSIDECMAILQNALQEFKDDPSLDRRYYQALEDAVEGRAYDETEEDWEYRIKFEAFLIHDWSIYPQVRSVTRPYEELDEGPCETISVYIIMLLYSLAGTALASFFDPRTPSIVISTLALMLMTGWTGKVFAYIPAFSFPIGFGRRVHFGNGKWTYKEQILASCALSMGNNSAYAQDAILALANNYFYGFKDAQSNFGFAIMLTLTSNLMGVGLAGIYRVFLVYPQNLIYWMNLPQMRLCKSIVEPEKKEKINGWSLSGMWVFWITAIVFFCWYWITNFVIQFFSIFDWMSWISPNNNNLLTVCGAGQYSMGYTIIGTMDPTLTTMDAMITPFYSTFMPWFGMALAGLVVLGMFYQNSSYTGYIGANYPSLYDRWGESYNISRVLNEKNQLDKEEFLNYSMPYWSAGNLVSYGSFFVFYPAMIVYSTIEYGNIIRKGLRQFGKILFKRGRGLEIFDDHFSRAQKKYKEVPEWWYLFVLLASVGVGIATVEYYSFTETPVWTIFFGIGLSAVFIIPFGILYAITSTSMDINVLFELVIGLTVRGNGTALMISKVYATNFLTENGNFIDNLKLGHYCNIPPRAMFRTQIVSLICNSFVQAGIITWQSTPNAIENMCSLDNYNTNKFVCSSARTMFNAAVQWGTIGPQRVLRDLYPGMRYCFLLGALFPLPFWFCRHFVLAYARRHGWGELQQGASKFRNSVIVRNVISLEWLIQFNEILILTGALGWGASPLSWYTTTLYLGAIFAVYLPKYYPKWWAKYNYLMYAGSTVGNNIGGVIVFFAVQYKNVPNFDWWGVDAGVNLMPQPNLPPPADGNGFGPLPRW